MSNHMIRILPIILACAASLAAADASLLSNGNFETDANKDGIPDGWSQPTGVSFEKEGTNHFARLTGAGPSTQVSLYREMPLNGAKAVTISYRVRYADVKRGAQPWHDARIIIEAKDAEKKAIKGAFPHPFFTGSSSGWVEKSISRVLPAEAETIAVMPALFMVESGTFDIDDITITPIDPDKMPASK
jgi:endoglucanase